MDSETLPSPTPTDTAALLRAVAFAAHVHAQHRRKGAAQEPYVNHVIEVALLLAEHGAPLETVIAGLLHDTVEDSADDPQPVTPQALEAAFGRVVADLVAEATDDKSLPKETRKALQVRHAPDRSAQARLLKLADKISNLRAVADAPPSGWDHARRVEYLGWAGRVAAGLKGVDPGLDALFDRTYRMAVQRLAAEVCDATEERAGGR